MNENFIQFGVFSDRLSVDEEMVPFFGRHTSKMYMRNKPINFGLKFWCRYSDDDYLYCFFSYGSHVVRNLMNGINPKHDAINFDSFFSSYTLFSPLKKKGIWTTGTVRKNRLKKCPLEVDYVLKKSRRTFDRTFDPKTNLRVVKRHDNALVVVASNLLIYSRVSHCNA